jgi:MoxR-like ATPase
MNRFNYTICVSWLPEAEEAKLIRSKTGLSNSSVEKMVQVANKVRAGYEAEQLDRPISTRNLLSWAREVKRGALRIKGATALPDRDFWKAVVVPAAAPTILNGMADHSSREAIAGFLLMK